MRRARQAARPRGQKVELFAALLREDSKHVPEGFTALPTLARSTASEFPELTDRSLPLIADIVQGLFEATDAELLVLTNADIGLYEDFYLQCRLIHQAGYDAFTITRRNNLPKRVSDKRLGPEDLDLIYKLPSLGHPGHDCFVFHRNLWSMISMGRLFLGFPPWGSVMSGELRRYANRFKNLTRLHATFHLGCDAQWKDDPAHPLWQQNRAEAAKLGYEFQSL